MLRSPFFVTLFASGYLLVYCLCLPAEDAGLHTLASLLFLFSPLVMGWLSYTVIRYGKYESADLQEGEEFGYSDRLQGNSRQVDGDDNYHPAV